MSKTRNGYIHCRIKVDSFERFKKAVKAEYGDTVTTMIDRASDKLEDVKQS